MMRRAAVISLSELTFCVEHPSGPIYFQVAAKGSSSGQVSSQRIVDVLSKKPLTYVSSFVKDAHFAKNIWRHNELNCEILKESSEVLSATRVTAFNLVDRFEYGFFVELRNDMTPQSFLETVKNKGLLGDSASFIACIDDDKPFAHPLDEGLGITIPVTPLCPPQIHPAFIFPDTNAVYKSIERVYDVLAHFDSLEEVKELLSICNTYIQTGSNWNKLLPLKAKYPVIVIEGLDATGKTTLARKLGAKFDGIVLKSPPDCIGHLRSKFDSHPELLRRAFYAVGNYVFAKMISDESSKGVVFADRFWNSTAAYAIAKEVSVGGAEYLPPIGHEIYNWPTDLLQPNAVILLTVNDTERRRRLLNRGSAKTDEEIRLEQSSHFRQRLEEAYLRMRGPTMLRVDASGTEEEALMSTFQLLKSEDLV